MIAEPSSEDSEMMASKDDYNFTVADRVSSRLFGLLAEEGDEVVPVLGLLEAAKGHLGAGNVLLGVLEVLELGCVSGCSGDL